MTSHLQLEPKAEALWKRDLDKLLKKFAKSNEKLKTMEGCFNKCLATSEAFFERFSADSKMQILRLEGYKGDLSQAHPKWKKFSNERYFIVHYVLCCDDVIVDLTAKQFNANEQFPKFQSLEELKKDWQEIEVFKKKPAILAGIKVKI